MKLRCKIFGHKWKWQGRSGMSDEKTEGFLVYECIRCGILCREKEDTEEREILK